MPLRILYYIRQKDEITLTELFIALFRSPERVSPSERHFFANHLSELENFDFIRIYTKGNNSAETSCGRYSDERKRYSDGFAQRVVTPFVRSILERFDDAYTPNELFLSVTGTFERIRQVIGYSVTNDFKLLHEQKRRNHIFGEIDPNISSRVFVIMPFNDQLIPVFRDHIKVVCDELNYQCLRADLIDSSNMIINDIWSLINNADIIICECTGKNANVFYELGIAHTIGKNVICIAQNTDDIPFDINQIRYIKYEYTPQGMKEFEQTLMRFMEACP